MTLGPSRSTNIVRGLQLVVILLLLPIKFRLVIYNIT